MIYRPQASSRWSTTSSDRKSGSAGMPSPRSTPFPYTTLFRSVLLIIARAMIRNKPDSYCTSYDLQTAGIQQMVHDLIRSEERFSRNAEPEIYTLSLHDALPICPAHHRAGDDPQQTGQLLHVV